MINFNWNDYDFKILQYGKGVFKKDMAGHSHSAYGYELHYVISGDGVLNTADNSYVLSEGMFFITGPNIYHQQCTNKSNPLSEIFIYLEGSGKETQNYLVSSFLSTPFFICHNEDLAYYFKKIITEQQEQKLGYENAVIAFTILLLTEITRIYHPDYICSKPMNENLNDTRFIAIDNAFINNPDTITLSQLSDEIGLSERQTQRLLKKYYGKSFRQKKNEALN